MRPRSAGFESAFLFPRASRHFRGGTAERAAGIPELELFLALGFRWNARDANLRFDVDVRAGGGLFKGLAFRWDSGPTRAGRVELLPGLRAWRRRLRERTPRSFASAKGRRPVTFYVMPRGRVTIESLRYKHLAHALIQSGE